MFRGLFLKACTGPRNLALQQQQQQQAVVAASRRLFTTRQAQLQQQQPDGGPKEPISSASSERADQTEKGSSSSSPTSSSGAGVASLEEIFGGGGSTSSSSSAFASSSSSPLSSSSPASKAKQSTTTGTTTDDWQLVLNSLRKRYGSDGENSPRMHTPEDEQRPFDPQANFEQLWKTRQTSGPLRPAKPSDGRVCDITNDTDVSRGFQSLNSILARNNVRQELRLGDRYEKPNQQRRRLRSERHRKRFAEAVRKKVRLVMELKSRGA